VGQCPVDSVSLAGLGLVVLHALGDHLEVDFQRIDHQLVQVDGLLESESGVRHSIAGRLRDLFPC